MRTDPRGAAIDGVESNETKKELNRGTSDGNPMRFIK
jgi:hypothetical protein